MQHSTELGDLATALSAAQGEFEAVSKDSTNPFFKSRYSSLPTVVKSATPILVKHGLSISQFPGHDDHGHTLTTWLLHKSGQFIQDTMRLKPVKDDPQGQGSALTYGRRYSYMAALGLVADEDDDGNAGSATKAKAPARPKSAPPKTPTPTPEKAATAQTTDPNRIRSLLTKYGKTADWWRHELSALGANVEPISEAQTDDERKKATWDATVSLTLEQVLEAVDHMGGSAQDLA